jgi:hypothetical protein
MSLQEALRHARGRLGLKVIHYSILENHLHLVVEAADKRALARGMQGLQIRMARGVNKNLGTRGKLFVDRYHVRALRTPREVRNALAYVLNNCRKHEAERTRVLRSMWLDPCSSATYFDGWKERKADPLDDEAPVVAPSTWLLRVGWRRHGPIPIDEIPGTS